jgi:hypothetical protein
LKKLYVFWLKILSQVLVAAYWICRSHFYRWLTSQFASSSPSSIVSVAPFRQREIAGISCRLQSNSDTDIFNVAAEKPLSVREIDLWKNPTCAKDWKNQPLLPNKYYLCVTSIAVVYYVGIRRKTVAESRGT